MSSVVGGIVSDSGSLTFSDSKAGDTFAAASITSVQITEAGTPVAGPSTTDGSFTITGTATLNGGAGRGLQLHGQRLAAVPGQHRVHRRRGVRGQRPQRLLVQLAVEPWDKGETVAITATQPVLATTTTKLTSSANPSVYDQPVTFTAAVSSSTPASASLSGYVSFAIDGGAAVNEPISNGQATYETTRLGVGTHSVVATYLGTSIYATSSATIASQVTKQASTTTTLSYSGSFIVGQPLTLSATVATQSPSYDEPTGTVTFLDGTTSLGSVALAGTSTSQSVKLSLPTGLAAGSHSITAVYGGDTNTLGSTSAALSKTVAQLATSTTLTTSVNPVVVNQPVTLTATVYGSSISTVGGIKPTGMVTFYDGSANLGSIAVGSSGIVQLPVTFTTAGSHSLQALYSGDATFLGSTGTLSQSVASTPTAPHVALGTSANPAIVGQPITFTAYVYAKSASTSNAGSSGATGAVTLLDGTSTLGMATLANGQASFSVSSLGVGPHSITAKYSGDANFTAGTSSVLTETIALPTPGTVTGQGTLLSKQDAFGANVVASVVYGVASYSGPLTFSDSKAGDTFTAATITSVQIIEVGTPVSGPSTTNGSFTITGTSTLNGGTNASYNFVASGSLPFPANAGSTGGLGFVATGPNGFSYNSPWKPWDPGQTVAITVTQPILAATTTKLTSSANPSVYEQPVTFTASVSSSVSLSRALDRLCVIRDRRRRRGQRADLQRPGDLRDDAAGGGDAFGRGDVPWQQHLCQQLGHDRLTGDQPGEHDHDAGLLRLVHHRPAADVVGDGGDAVAELRRADGDGHVPGRDDLAGHGHAGGDEREPVGQAVHCRRGCPSGPIRSPRSMVATRTPTAARRRSSPGPSRWQARRRP